MLAMNRGEYTIAKTAVSAAARLFAARLCNEQIGVYEVRPGLIKTDMTIPATAYYDELIAKGLVPWGRWGYPADIASTVRAMAEGKLIYTCGQAVAIDGGLSMPALLRLNHERSVTTPGFIQYQYRDTGL
ncbi:3-ketoacyl-ACP reductase [Escherichia coli]|uniref:3-ketoacyl-ACP reductase n=1 Tax=Escherichia coli TaxID=562 RepID=A0A377E473_ECOLX|nr:3-ketoacyl-ACP reductase [Escherichia coli]